ncbi:hypothetical protein C5167_008241 [Papaver somniferum]|uniref:Amino acid transporter transmembrane domain-containing protein n=1 Tax=Papaver somniferum TaxID=3469 RepID=A0A4Y7JTZ7_PAPSO|nr:amino acid transporter AVT6C-like [Papaver somniferum]RZC64554.1 hypothetical protein C5167_008241 [Papaver somniferum]
MKMKSVVTDEISYPLLPKFVSTKNAKDYKTFPVVLVDEDDSSHSGLVFNVTTSIIGGGIMSIPAILQVLGIVPALMLIVIVAILSEISVDFLLRFTVKKTTYAGLMGESFGLAGSFLLQICILVTNLGCLIIYLIVIGDVLSGTGGKLEYGKNVHMGILRESFGIQWWNSRNFSMLLVTIFVMLPLVLLKRIESLRYTSAVSVFLAVVFVSITMAMAIFSFWEGKDTTARLLPAEDSSFSKLFTAVPIIVTAFTFQPNVHPIRAELSKPSDMTSAIRISLVICVAIYSIVGISGYQLFGDSTMSDILSNFSSTTKTWILTDIIRLSYAIHIMLVFPILNFSLRVNVDELFFPRPKWPALSAHPARFVSITCFLLLIVYVAAVVIPNIWYFFQFIGSTTSLCLAFIFPSAIVLRDYHGVATRRDKVLAVLMITLAVEASSIAISSNVITLI